MAATVEEVCNIALSYVGSRAFITDIGEDSLEAIVCSVHFDATRRQVLGERWWNFASASQFLAQISAAAPQGWSFMYALPSDLLPGKQRQIFAGARPGLVRSVEQVPFNLRWVSGQGQVLLTDHPAPELLYTRDVLELPYWPESAADAIAWGLAPKLAFGLNVDLRKGTTFAQGYLAALDRGMAEDMNSVRGDQELVSKYEAGRG